MRRVRVVASGRVQGVFYRATCARLARALGLAGYVRNLPDGRVEAVFEGPDDDVEEMVAWSRRGPDLAHVDDLNVVAEPPVGGRGFEVRG
ncbi:MAG: acylphosphatase [Actinomycetota bacterium]